MYVCFINVKTIYIFSVSTLIQLSTEVSGTLTNKSLSPSTSPRHSQYWGQLHCIWNRNATSNSNSGIVNAIVTGVLFLKGVVIGEDVIGVFNYFSTIFSCNILTNIICYR